jgi:hypothetical protein
MRRRYRTGSTLSDLRRGARFGRSAAGQPVSPAATPPSTGVGTVTAPQVMPFAIGGQALAPESFDITKFASGIRPVSIVAALPTLPDAGYPSDSVVILTSDHKLYRNAAGTWVRSVPTTDLTGTITETQITDSAVSTNKLAANAVTADKILAGTITADKMVANSLTAGQIAAGAIGADELAANAVTAGKILAGEVTTAKLNVVTILVDGATWTNNSPSAGRVAWSGAKVYYDGAEYSITNGDTNLKYIWWSSTTSNTTFQSSNTRPTLTDVEFLIATNDVGIHDLAWNAASNAGVFPTHLSFDSFAQLFIYGDGVDGDVTISGNTTLTRDMSYNNLTINSGVVLNPSGYRVFVRNTLTNNGFIRVNGAHAVDGRAGAPSGNMGGGGDGGTGANQGAGAGAQQGESLTNALGGVGGTGGNGTGVPDPQSFGASGGAITNTRANRHGLMLLGDTSEIRGGTGGGGGGGNPTLGGGGAGGGGAGVIIIAAKTINNGSGSIEAKGGDGDSSGSGGGGGGGGGGAIVLVYRTVTQGTITAAGGTGGAIGGGVAAGANGAPGVILSIQQEA